jgi:hypothetical protein
MTDKKHKQTPPKWSEKHKSDARKAQSTGSYPDYFSWKTRSGHVLQLDDSKGAETVTLQHRSGTAIQMTPDGSLHITAHNGKYEVTFGENRMTISGAQDITVKGDASLRVYGDYNVTCHKDYNLTVLGNFNLAAKNHNRHILGNIDTQARNENKKLMGSSAKIARGGIAYHAKGSVAMTSQSDKGFFGGAAGAMLWAKNGDIVSSIEEQGDHYVDTKDGSINHVADGQDGSIRMQSKQGKMEFKSKDDMNQTVEQGHHKITADTGDIGQEAKTGSIETKAPAGGVKTSAKNFSVNATQSAEVITQQKLDLRATGDASLTGATTHVTGQSNVNIKGGSMANIDGPSGLNLNSLLSVIMPAINLQIPFDFGSITDAETKKLTSDGTMAPDIPAGNDEVKGWDYA